MKLSVVVPVYNVEKYLRTCVDSILNQSTQAYEIILVDDGSTDESGKICEEYAHKNSCVTVVHQENAGLGLTRNAGLEKVTGDYVTFVDSDDFWDADYIEKISAVMEETGCDTCKTSFKRVDEQGNDVSAADITPGAFQNEEIQKELIPRLIGSAPDKKDSIPMSSCCTVYSMKIIQEHDLRFVSERIWISEDLIFNLNYYFYSQYVVLSDYIGYNYRINPGSLTTKYMADRYEKCKAMYQKETEMLQEMGLYDLCRYRLDRQFFICLRMCFMQLHPQISGMKKKEATERIMAICEDDFVQNRIAQYPRNELGVSQKLFLLFIQHKMAALLAACFCSK